MGSTKEESMRERGNCSSTPSQPSWTTDEEASDRNTAAAEELSLSSASGGKAARLASPSPPPTPGCDVEKDRVDEAFSSCDDDLLEEVVILAAPPLPEDEDGLEVSIITMGPWCVPALLPLLLADDVLVFHGGTTLLLRCRREEDEASSASDEPPLPLGSLSSLPVSSSPS